METTPNQGQPLQALPFPPITPQQILNTSFHAWYPTFRSITPKARIIPLSPAFLSYLRSDGIILPPDHKPVTTNPEDSGYDDEDEEDESIDPSEQWPEIHAQITATIKELGGKVVPKLNWSAPKDATWISTTNDMECRSANDVYLLLKSSDFITHDLEYPFDGCSSVAEGNDGAVTTTEVPYHLVLRKSFNLNPALEFRCFVRERRIIGICQREMNFFEFLKELRPKFKRLIMEFLEEKIIPPKSHSDGDGSEERKTNGDGKSAKKGGRFPDANFVVDIYIPPPYERVWLIDINPWAPRTDPLLFSWLELLTMDISDTGKGQIDGDSDADDEEDDDDEDDISTDEETDQEFIRIPFRPSQPDEPRAEPPLDPNKPDNRVLQDSNATPSQEIEEIPFSPPFRLVNRDDPEAYQFSATKYSAHKLPKDVVVASLAPGGMKDMMEEWKRIMQGKGQDVWSEDEDDDD